MPGLRATHFAPPQWEDGLHRNMHVVLSLEITGVALRVVTEVVGKGESRSVDHALEESRWYADLVGVQGS